MMLKRFDDRDRPAVGQLAGQHQFQPGLRFFGDGGGDAHDVLHRIAEAQAVALAVVDQAGSPRPGKGDQAVVQSPDVDRVIQILVGRFHSQAAQFGVPVGLQLVQFGLSPFQRAVLGHRACPHRVGVADPQHDQQFLTFARLQSEIGLHNAAGVIAVGIAVAATALLHRQGLVIAAIRTEKRLTAGVVPIQRRADQCHPRLHGRCRHRCRCRGCCVRLSWMAMRSRPSSVSPPLTMNSEYCRFT